jgi:hypothetical protein
MENQGIIIFTAKGTGATRNSDNTLTTFFLMQTVAR